LKIEKKKKMKKSQIRSSVTHSILPPNGAGSREQGAGDGTYRITHGDIGSGGESWSKDPLFKT